MSKCKKCGVEFEGGYCTNCGTKLESVKCVICGLYSTGKYCSNCGSVMPIPVDNKMNEIYRDNTTSESVQKSSKIEISEVAKDIGGAAKAIFDFATAGQRQRTDKIRELDEQGVAYCPKCLSVSLSANKKGFGIGKAVVGTVITGGLIGLVAGNIGAKKVRVTCLKCGYQFWAGKK